MAQAGVDISGRAIAVLPRAWMLALGRGIGRVGHALVGSRRRIALHNLELALGDTYTRRELERIARRSFAHMGMNLVEMFALPVLARRGLDDLVEFSGLATLDEIRARGEGVLLLSAHLGNWDLMAAAMAGRGYPVSLITKIPHNDFTARNWLGVREDAGVRIFTRRSNSRDALRYLRQGGMVGFVLDQNARIKDGGVFVPFFGRPACTLTNLGRLAGSTGLPVVPIYTFREGRRHKVVVDEPLEAPGLPCREDDVLERTRQYVAWTEEVVRRHPDQWTWLHRRWKTRPLDTQANRDTGSSAGRRVGSAAGAPVGDQTEMNR